MSVYPTKPVENDWSAKWLASKWLAEKITRAPIMQAKCKFCNRIYEHAIASLIKFLHLLNEGILTDEIVWVMLNKSTRKYSERMNSVFIIERKYLNVFQYHRTSFENYWFWTTRVYAIHVIQTCWLETKFANTNSHLKFSYMQFRLRSDLVAIAIDF